MDLRDAIAAGMHGPRILACQLAVTMTGGHGYPWFAIREADGPDEVRKAVREQLKGGADFIKIMSSGGFSHYPHEDPEATQFTVDELRAAAEEALMPKHTFRRCARYGGPHRMRNGVERQNRRDRSIDVLAQVTQDAPSPTTGLRQVLNMRNRDRVEHGFEE